MEGKGKGVEGVQKENLAQEIQHWQKLICRSPCMQRQTFTCMVRSRDEKADRQTTNYVTEKSLTAALISYIYENIVLTAKWRIFDDHMTNRGTDEYPWLRGCQQDNKDLCFITDQINHNGHIETDMARLFGEE